MKHSVVLFRSAVKALLLIGFMAFALGASAQVKLSVQGLLKKGDGTSQPDGNVTMKFNFYKASDNSFVASVTATDVPVSGGVYSALLDVSQSSPSNALTFSTEYVVGLQVNGGTEMTPRINLTAAPYALALNGVSNVFPTLGTVKVDAIDVAGAVNATGAVSTNSTLSVAGNATLSGTTNTKTVIADGRMYSNDGFGYQSGGTGFGTGLFFDGSSKKASIYTEGNVRFHAWDDNRNYYRASAGHIFDVGNVTLSNNLQTNGFINCNSFIRSGGTFTFTNDDDSGMYSPQDGVLQFRVNGVNSVSADPGGYNIYPKLFLHNVENGIDGHNLEWNRIGDTEGNNNVVSINTSTRRFKYNIVPLDEDFSQILHLQPRRYTRKIDPSSPTEIGYIAEEVDSLGMKCLVLYEDRAKTIPLSINYKKLVLFTNEIVKMHHADIEKLKAEVAALTAEKNALRTENASLRADAKNQQADFGKQLDELSRRLKSLETAASNR